MKLEAKLAGYAATAALMATITVAAGAQKPEATSPPSAADGARSASYYHYSLARMYEDMAAQNGRQDYATQAIEEYKLALDADPKSQQLQDGLASLYLRLGRIREAVSAAQEQVKRNPSDADAHVMLGRIYLRSLGDMQGPQSGQMLQLAIAEYETIVRLKPDDLESHLLLGQLYGLNHDSAKAEQEFKRAQRIDNGSEEAALNLARLYTEQGNLQKASDSLTAIPEDDRSARMEFALGGIYDSLKKPHEAAAAYKRALDQDPDNADARRALGNALLNDGQTNAAGKVYGDLVQTDPQDAASLIRLAATQRNEGHYEDALATLKKAQAMTADNPELPWNFALTYDALGRYPEAAKTLRDTLTAGEHSNGVYTEGEKNNRSIFLDRLALIEREQNDSAAALATYKTLAAMGGEYAERAAEGEVDTFREAHQWKEATAAADAAAKAQPGNREAQLMYARQLGDAGKLPEGVALATRQLSGTPDDREVFITLADMNIRARHWKDAAAAIDKADAIAGKPEEKVLVYFYRGTLAERQKMYDEADAQFRKVLAIDANNAATENYLGYMNADRGAKLTESLALVKKAVDLDPQNGAYLDSLGWCYFKLGEYAIAEATLRKAIARTATDASIHDHLAEAYAHQGKWKQATAEWQRASTEYATTLPADADPVDVARVEHKLEGARVKMAHSSVAAPGAK